jgi:hypothetical protein
MVDGSYNTNTFDYPTLVGNYGWKRNMLFKNFAGRTVSLQEDSKAPLFTAAIDATMEVLV